MVEHPFKFTTLSTGGEWDMAEWESIHSNLRPCLLVGSGTWLSGRASILIEMDCQINSS